MNKENSKNSFIIVNPKSQAESDETSGQLELTFDPELSTPIYEQIKSCIREQIITGRLHSGQRIPSARQISQKIGVSYVTVTRGLNALVNEGILEARIPGGTYVTQRRGNRLQTIGVIGYEPYHEITGHSQYYRRLISLLLEDVIRTSRTVVYNYWPADTPLGKMFNDMSLVDGVILLYSDQDHRIEQILEVQRIGIPIVCLGKTFEQGILTIDSDNVADTSRAVRHLLSMGHRRIALVGTQFDEKDNSGQPCPLRWKGYRKAMEQHGPGFDPALVVLGNPTEQAEHLLALADPPTAALIMYSASTVPRLIDNLQNTPLQPGKGLYLCAYDENLWNTIGPRGIDFMRIEQPLEAIAADGVECIVRMLDDHNYHPTSKFLPSRIVRIADDGRQEVLD